MLATGLTVVLGFLAASPINARPSPATARGLHRQHDTHSVNTDESGGGLVSGWAYLGCIDRSTSRMSEGYAYHDSHGTSAEMCQATCEKLGFQYAGLEDSYTCHCDSTIDHSTLRALEHSGDACKGDHRYRVYKKQYPATSIPEKRVGKVPRAATSSAAPPTYSTIGCWGDASVRTLSGPVLSSSSLTIVSCVSYCSNLGYKYAGAENSNQCYCGNSYNTTRAIAASSCRYTCAGDIKSICGGSWALTLMALNVDSALAASLSSVSKSASTTVISSSTSKAPASTSTSKPTPTLSSATSTNGSGSSSKVASLASVSPSSSAASKSATLSSSSVSSRSAVSSVGTSISSSKSSILSTTTSVISSSVTSGKSSSSVISSSSKSSASSATVVSSTSTTFTTSVAKSITTSSTSFAKNSTIIPTSNSTSTVLNVTATATATTTVSATGCNAACTSVIGVAAPPKATGTKSLFAHHMIGNTYSYTPAVWSDDINLAQSAGIDGFALNYGRDDWQPARLDDAYLVASATGFKLFLSLDVTSLSCSSAADAVTHAATIVRHANSSAQYIYQNRTLVSTFGGEYCTFGQSSNLAGWNYLRQLVLTQGYSIYLIPAVFSDISQFNTPSMAWMDGEFNWNSGWPMGSTNLDGSSDVSYQSALAGKTYMPAISPAFFTYYGPSSWNKDWIYRSDNWLLASRMEQVVQMRDEVDFAEIISWNDYGESHYIGPVRVDQPNSQGWTNGMPHTAWLNVISYYAAAFKTGSYPSTADNLWLWSRPHPRDANPSAPTAPRPTGSTYTDDNLYAFITLSSPANVTITSGSNNGTWILPAGVNKISLASAPGAIGGSIKRGSTVVKVFDSTGTFSYTSTPVDFNYNYFVAQA